MKSDMVLLGAAGAVIALVVVYAMAGNSGQNSGQNSVQSKKRRYDDEVVNDPLLGEHVLVASPTKSGRFDNDHRSTNAAALAEAFAQVTQGGKLEGFGSTLATGFRNLANVGDKAQHLFDLDDESRDAIEKMAIDKGKAVAKTVLTTARNVVTSDAAKAKFAQGAQVTKQAASTVGQAAAKAASATGQAAKSVFSSLGSKIAQGARSVYERVHHDTLQKRSTRP
jgi:hypothetical protein